MLSWLTAFALSLAPFGAFSESQGQTQLTTRESKRPNIVFFLVDDLGWQDTSVPFHEEVTPLNQHFRTPALERLAASGVLFTRAYSCAVCSPSRTSWMTGQNAARHRVTNWTLHPDQDSSHKTARLGPPKGWRLRGLQPDDDTLPKHLQAQGYFTIHAGKAHWGARTTAGSDPTKLGFDVNIAGHAAGGPGHYHGQEDYGNQRKGPWGIPGLTSYHGLPVHLTDATTAEALQAVDSALEKEQPFFLYLAHYAVHAPLQEHAPYAQSYRDAGVNETEARYASMVQGVDTSLGAVMSFLEARGVADETIVVYSSDNGGLSAHARGKTPSGTGDNTHNRPLRAGKGSAYEGGIRVPMVVAWARPDSESELQAQRPINSNVRVAAPTLIEDVFPSLLRWSLADSAPIAETADNIDGRDLTPLLSEAVEEETRARNQRPLIFHYPHVWYPGGLTQQEGYEPHSSIILGDWKAIYFYEDSRWELYDLNADLGEQNNLATNKRQTLQQLSQRLQSELDLRDAQYPAQLESGEPERIRQPQ